MQLEGHQTEKAGFAASNLPGASRSCEGHAQQCMLADPLLVIGHMCALETAIRPLAKFGHWQTGQLQF